MPASAPSRRAGRFALAAACLVAVAACAAPIGAPKQKALEHPEAKYLVWYGPSVYRVDIRYVDVIGQSVMAVREGQGDSAEADGERLELVLKGGISPPVETPFADSSYEAVAEAIARGIRDKIGICPAGRPMQISTDGDDEARTMYRGDRQAWVVFALCPEGQVVTG